MKKLIDFWNKDIINKLIIIISMMLVMGVFAFIFMIFNMPEGKSLREAISEFMPSPSTSAPADLAAAPSVTPTDLPFNLTVPPTEGAFNANPSTPDPALAAASPTSTPELLVIPTLGVDQFTLTPLPSAAPIASLNTDCIPKATSQAGKAVSILEGNTIKVLIDGLVYVVRYIGVDVPTDAKLAEKARLQNAELIFGKEITLIADQSDKDANGRLLRYVMVGDIFVNLDLISQGFGSAADTPPDYACAQTFQLAEKSAGGAVTPAVDGTVTVTP
ncbi:MAG: thermonuclease family protein [Chloroflexi bacterium]|nr:thermonuclease family protein [Chloroflexota bacterium]